MADVTRPPGTRRAASVVCDAVTHAADRVAQRDLVQRFFLEELADLSASTGRRLSETETLGLFDELRREMTAEDRDLFLRRMLGGVQALADDGRRRLRDIIQRHLQRLDNAGKP